MMVVMFVLAALNVQAQMRVGATLKIRDIDGRRIFAVINGRTFPKAGRVLNITNVQPGATRVKVYVVRNGKMIASPGTMIYGGNLLMKNSYVYRCTVDGMNNMDVQEFCCLDNNGGFYEQYYDDHYGHYDDHNHDWDDNFWHGNQNNGFGNQGVVLPVPMNGNAFSAFLQTVRNNNFDSGKEQIIRTQLANTWVTCQQLRQLVDVMTFGSAKLEIAKFGLNSLTDPQNMFMLYDAFTFNSAKTELANHAEKLAANSNSNYSKMISLNQQANTFNNNNNNWNQNNNNWNQNNNNNNNNWNQNNNNYNQNNNNNWNQNNVMSDGTFGAFLQTLKNNNFDSGKQTILSSQLSNNWFTAQQVRTIVDQFTFDSGKLEAAKAAALKVVDRQNLFVVYDAFDYESSKRNFADFVATLR
jgi:hypothetical protein